MSAAKRIPSLDGLRAISIVLVIAAHATAKTFPRTLGCLGELGVRIFFIISGFLITSLLLSEREETGRISLKSFYARRALRILPALYVFLLAMFVASSARIMPPTPTIDFVHALTFTTNYAPERAWTTGHVWSLSVEEQFYILWPAAVVLLGIARGLHGAVAFVLLAPLLRVGLFFAVPSYRPYITESFETVGDAIAVGCILAGAREWLYERAIYRRVLESPLVWLVAAAVVVVNTQRDRFVFNSTVGAMVMNVGVAMLIDRLTRRPPAILEHPVARFIGVRSYSLYLWQQPFMLEGESVFSRLPLNIVGLGVMAFLSYALVEKPMMKLRRHFT